MRQYLSAQIQAASQIELDEIVNPSRMRNLKAQDPHPEIRLYSIGHEGEANLHLPGIGTKTFTWIQAAVRAIADKLNIGTAVFDRHDPNTNSHVGRTQIGEVVGKTLKQIGDRLNTLAAIYIYPEFKSRPLEVASFEAEIEFSHDGHQALPTDIKSVSGIALSNSGLDTPGFPGATLLSVVQAFEGEFGEGKMNQSDVKKAVSELGLKPSQVFDIGDIMADSTVATKMRDGVADLSQKSERLQKERDEAKAQVVKLENTNAETDKQLKQHTMQSKSVSVLDASLADPERKLDDRAKTFIKRNLKEFTTTAENEDDLKAAVGKFVDAQTVEYGEQAKLFGVEIGDKAPDTPLAFKLPAKLTVKGQQAPPANVQSQVGVTPDREEVLSAEMNPETNPYIAGGKAAEEALKT